MEKLAKFIKYVKKNIIEIIGILIILSTAIGTLANSVLRNQELKQDIIDLEIKIDRKNRENQDLKKDFKDFKNCVFINFENKEKMKACFLIENLEDEKNIFEN